MPAIAGTWQLVAEEARDAAGAAVPLAYGRTPLGSVTFAADGRLAAVLSDGSAEAIDPRALLAFCGRYDFDGETLVMHLDAGTSPAMLAAPQHREARFEGDRMTLAARNAEGVTRVFTWRRLAPS